MEVVGNWLRADKSKTTSLITRTYSFSPSPLSPIFTHHGYQDPDTGLFQQQRLAAVMIAVEQIEGGMRNRIDSGCTKKKKLRKANIHLKLQCCMFLTRTFCCEFVRNLRRVRTHCYTGCQSSTSGKSFAMGSRCACTKSGGFKLLKEVRLGIRFKFLKEDFLL